MEYIVVIIAALIASALTFFSGFGLGTILMPVFAIFFPIEVAIAMTAIVHFFNGLFKTALTGRHADLKTILYFGAPAMITALVGAYVLTLLTGFSPLYSYTLYERQFFITPVKLSIAVLLLIFTIIELLPNLEKVSFSKDHLPLGGVLSGFFGGLSGHQGALRSAFLIKAGLSKEAFVATGAMISALIDFSRLAFYTVAGVGLNSGINYALLACAVAAAFVGALMGNQLLKKVTLGSIQWIVSTMLIVFSILLGAGLI